MKAKKSTQRLYECVLVTVDSEEIDSIIGNLVSNFSSNEEFSGEQFRILHREMWGKRTLAYKIRGLKKANYSVLYISTTNSGVKLLDKRLKMHPYIVRFLISKCDQLPNKLPPIALEYVENR